MANFAQIDNNNIVLRVIVVSNNDILDKNGNESETIGKNFCNKLLGGNWIQTSYNKNFRKNYAGIGYKYDSIKDAFIPPKPFPSWILDESTCNWKSPTPYPNDGNHYNWDEANLKWV